MIKKKAVIVNKMGLHARPAYYFVEIAQEFESEITYTAKWSDSKCEIYH